MLAGNTSMSGANLAVPLLSKGEACQFETLQDNLPEGWADAAH